jgi:hypothetical protein
VDINAIRLGVPAANEERSLQLPCSASIILRLCEEHLKAMASAPSFLYIIFIGLCIARLVPATLAAHAHT